MRLKQRNWVLNLLAKTNLKDIYWLAGILEGEANFRMGATSPAISLTMSDLDIVNRVRAITKTEDTTITVRPPQENRKECYTTCIYGSLAIQWMMTIYPIMGNR